MNDGLMHSGIPLGGLGTGTVELRNDGLFHEWQIMNNAPWGPGPRVEPSADSLYFGLQVDGAREKHSAILCTPTGYIRGKNTTNDPYGMPWLQHASKIDAQTRFPFTTLKYQYDKIPLDIQLEAFSPFIPLDSKNSGLPLAYLSYSIKNTSRRPLRVTLFGCQRNLTGYTTPDSLSTIEAKVKGKRPHLVFSREDVDAGRSDAGSMVLGLLADGPGSTSHGAHFRRRDIWDPMRDTGALENIDLGHMEQDLGNMGASQRVHFRKGLPFGALARTVTLQPGKSVDLTFVLAWYFPNLIEREIKRKCLPASNIGHMYENWFDSAEDVFAYAARKHQTLREETMAFASVYYDSTMPDWLLDAISAQFTTLSKASWWDRKGRFGIWEGLGCCGLQTTDITHYGSFPITQFFPEVEKSQMRLSKDNVEIEGKIPHMMPANFACCDVDHRQRIDLIPQFILLIWRDLLWTGDKAYLEEMWPTIKASLVYFDTKDTDGDGLPNNTGPDQTYDQFPLKGTSAFVGFLYLAALKATAEMAAVMKEPDYAADIKWRIDEAERLLHEQLWNGRYYRLCHDPLTGESNEGVMADQLNGDWFLRQTAGIGLVDKTKAKSSLKAILEACTDSTGFLANCAWPEGDAVAISRHTADQANWPWSGVEYAVSAHLILLGMEKEGVKVARDVWDRYERMGMRFNHIECGGHYYRALSSWAVYLALGGYIVDILHKTLRLRLAKGQNRVVLTASTGWGVLETSRKSRQVKLTMMRGKLSLKQIDIKGLRFDKVRLSLGRKLLAADVEKGRVILDKTISIREANVLTLKFY